MQTLYALEPIQDSLKPEEPAKILDNKIEQSRKLFTYLMYFLSEVALYAQTDAYQKANKHLPSTSDLHVNTRITENEVIKKIIENPSYLEAIKELKPDILIDHNLVKKIYTELVSTPTYREYTELSTREKKQERNILEFIVSEFMFPNESFTNHIEENFLNWDDDSEMMLTLMLNYLAKPTNSAFTQILSEEKRTFAHQLLKTVQQKSETTLSLIKPRLKNWDADRIAALDMILLQMGVCEFLFFETIPTKVTINEYIDLAKSYSTEQSGQFINGLLDNINKDLTAQGKIEKRQYKNSTL